MKLKTSKDSPNYFIKNLVPEHKKRTVASGLHPEIEAAYNYVSRVLETSDYSDTYAWHGWALREAFLAGISYCNNLNHRKE